MLRQLTNVWNRANATNYNYAKIHTGMLTIEIISFTIILPSWNVLSKKNTIQSIGSWVNEGRSDKGQS